MADDRHRQEYPQLSRSDEHRSQPLPHRQHPSSKDGSQSAPHEGQTQPPPRTAMAASVTLPSIHDPRNSGYGAPPPPAGRPFGTDPRYASPNAVNGYPPPTGPQSQQPGGTYLPPLQPQGDPRSPGYPAQEQRPGFYDDRRPPPQQYHEQYPQDAYYYRGPPPGHAPNGYDYRGPPSHGAYGQEYGQPGGDRPREAPRQRTSIACKYCRKRKIRCSGHQNAPGGKCQNCARMNQECVFQPVSSSSSTAFIPVSAVPGGVPPGTQLFGAYGQPLAPNSVSHPQGHHGPPPPHPYPHAGGPPPPHASYYQPMQSPTESYSSFDDSQVVGRRRRRPSEEQEEGYRLPPPRSAGASEEDPRRRSPAEFSNNSSPGGLAYSRYPGPARQSPRNPALPPPSSTVAPGADSRSPVVQNGSSGSSTPAHQAGKAPGAPAGQPQQSSSSVMSLSNLVEKNDIDKTMISRLDRPKDGSTNPPAR